MRKRQAESKMQARLKTRKKVKMRVSRLQMMKSQRTTTWMMTT